MDDRQMVKWWTDKRMDRWMNGCMNSDKKIDNGWTDGWNECSESRRKEGAKKTQGEGTREERCVWDTETG